MNIEKHHQTGLALALRTLKDHPGQQGMNLLQDYLEQAEDAPVLEGESLQCRLIQLEAELEIYREKDRKIEAQRVRESRIEQVVDILFPNYNHIRDESKYPIRHPDTARWWNGASLLNSYETNDGKLHLEVKSYVGCNEYEEFECDVPAEWLDMEDPTEVIHAWCTNRKGGQDRQRRDREIREAQAEIQRQAQRLAELQHKH